LVEIPRVKYIGQKLTRLVAIKRKADIASTIAGTPVIILVRIKIAINNPERSLMLLSDELRFFFIVFLFSGLNFHCKVPP
jgi:hypothetical protein